MMQRKKIIAIFAVIIMAVCIAVGIYCSIGQPPKSSDFKITFMDLLYLYAIKPIFWACIGMLVVLFIGIGNKVPEMLKIILGAIVTVLILVYVCAAVLTVTGTGAKWASNTVLLCISHPYIFVMPGFVYGLCIK